MLDTSGMLISVMAKRSARLCVGFDNLEDCGFDCRDLAIDLFEALEHSDASSVQRERQSFSAVPAAVRSFTSGLASDVKFLQFEQELASGWARASNSSMAPMRARIAASRKRSVFASLPVASAKLARLTRIDLDERNASDAQRAFDGAMIGPGRFEHDPRIKCCLREPFDKRFVTSLVSFRWQNAGGRCRPTAGGRRDGLSTHRRRWYRCSSFPRLCLSFGALPRVSVQAKGKDEGDQTLARPVKRSAYSRSDPRR